MNGVLNLNRRSNFLKTLLTAMLATFFWTSASEASLATYTDRTAFEAALLSFSVDSLGGIASGNHNTYVRTDFTINTVAGVGSFGCINHSGCHDNSSKGFDNAYLWTYAGDETYTFGTAVNGFGFDYDNPGPYSGYKPILQGLTAPTDAGFFGVISDVALNVFTANNTGSYTIMDNITYGTTGVSAVPLPAGLPLYGAGLALMGFVGWRRKRKVSA